MTLILDTHFLIWIALESKRISEFPWLGRYRPWGVSPIALLEIQFLHEVGRVSVRNPEFVEAIAEDERFVIDDPPIEPVFRNAISLSWTRDPFDRLLSAHSLARRVPLCSLDDTIRDHHALLPRELRKE